MFKHNKLLILLIITLSLLYSAFAIANTDSKLSNMELIAENEYLQLYLDKTTTVVAVRDKITKYIWSTNPLEGTRDELLTQFSIRYDPRDKTKNNFTHSTQYNQFNISKLDQGVRIDYTLVDRWENDHYLPQLISKEQMEELLGNITNESDKKFILENYALVNLVKIEDEDERIEVRGLDKERVFGEYTLKPLKENYSARDKEDLIWLLLREKILQSRLDLNRLEDIKQEDLIYLRDNPTYMLKRIAPFFRTDMVEIIKETGFTPLDVAEIHLSYNLDPPMDDLEIFKIPLEYRLDGKDLVVKIPSSEIVYPVDVRDRVGDKFTFPLLSIELLRYFGAAPQGKEGYIFVPDGSGALIKLDERKEGASFYRAPVYGQDYSINPLIEENNLVYGSTTKKQVHLPVFGLKEEDKAFLAIIEKGEGIASIRANKARGRNVYHTVHTEFTTMPKGEIQLRSHAGDGEGSQQAVIDLYMRDIYQGDIQIRYSFLTGQDANYSGMARTYQDYLISRNKLEKVVPTDNIPFYLELVGAINRIQTVMGYPREISEPLTTFKQTQKIIDELIVKGINNINLKYTGWLKGGVLHDYPQKASLEESLGEKSDFLNLLKYLKEEQIDIFPNLGFLHVYNNKRFDGFNPKKDVAVNLMRSEVKTRTDQHNRATENSYVLSPRRLPVVMNNFLQDYIEYQVEGISLTHIGTRLSSDFRDDNLIDRQKAQEIVKQQLALLKDKEFNIMLSGTNAYNLKYTDHILNMPLTSSKYDIIDRSIPFYQMLVHGFINYSGEPINIQQYFTQDRQYILKLIETGTYPFYIGSYALSSNLKDTDFNNLFSINYKEWLEEALSYYQKVNQVLKEFQDKKIIYHKQLAENVYQTTYENDKSIIVNYNQSSVEINGVEIAGENFKLIEGMIKL